MAKMLTTTQAAKRLNISSSYLRELLSEGAVAASCKTTGGHWRWSEDDIYWANKALENGVTTTAVVPAANVTSIAQPAAATAPAGGRMTIFELLIVLIIIGILIALMARTFTSINANLSKTASNTRVRSALTMLKMCASDNDGLYGSYAELTGKYCMAGNSIRSSGEKIPLVNLADKCPYRSGVEMKNNTAGVCTFTKVEDNRPAGIDSSESTYAIIVYRNGDKESAILDYPDGIVRKEATRSRHGEWSEWRTHKPA